jgi:hypothetical protein
MRRAIAAVCMVLAGALPVGSAWAQTAPAPQHYDLNVYPVIAGSGAFDLENAPKQSGPAGTVTMNSAAPPPAYSFKDMLANTHGYVETQVSSRGGYGVEGGVSIPIVPGKADLDLGIGTGQITEPRWLSGNGKRQTQTYDTYYAGLHLHPVDGLDAEIAISGLRVHGPSEGAYTPFGAP